MHNRDPSPFCEAKGGRAERSETQGVHNPVTPPNPPVIPAKAGASADGTSIQRKTKHAASPSPFCEAKGGRGSEATAGGALPSPSMGEGQGEGERGGQGEDANDQPNLDVEAARKSMTRMANIFADIAKHAEDSSLTRCPYKDARSRCTAKFACRNQHFTKNPLNPPICTAKDGDLDYRSAWEID